MSVGSRLAAVTDAVAAERLDPTRVALVLSVGLVAALRSLPLPSVLRPDGVVLSSNDPYFYRYHVERLLSASPDAFDPVAVAGLLPEVGTGEPLTVAVLWLVTELLGGTQAVAGVVLAWYPVVTAVLSALVLYRVAVAATADARAGVATVGLFAVTPGHAFRTGLGFADHHAMDYLLLTLSFAALVGVAVGHRHDRRWVVLSSGGLGVGLGGGVLAWSAAPLYFVPAAVGILGIVASTAAGDSRERIVPLVAGTGLATTIAVGGHLLLGWQTAVTLVPVALVFAGTVVAAGLATLVGRTGIDRPGTVVVAVGAFGAAAGTLAVVVGAVPVVGRLEWGVSFLVTAGGVAETASIADRFGPVVGSLVMLGFAPVLALPAVATGLWRALYHRRPEWVVILAYGGYFFVLALLQRRFVGELTGPLAVLGGVGGVALFGWLDLVDRPAPAFADGLTGRDDPTDRTSREVRPLDRPDRRRAVVGGLLAATLAGFPTLYAAVIHRAVTIAEGPRRAARFMAEYAAEHGWTYPRNYVLSRWGRNRMYNHVVSGESRSYAFARQRYGRFLAGSDPAGSFERFADRVGFVVTTETPPGDLTLSGSMHELLHQRWASDGTQSDTLEAVGHYRGVFAADDGRLKVFALVPGAVVEGYHPSGGDVVVLTTRVSVPGATFDYERRAETDADGRFAVRVAQPGTYQVGGKRVTVDEAAVHAGRVVAVDDVSADASSTDDAGRGR